MQYVLKNAPRRVQTTWEKLFQKWGGVRGITYSLLQNTESLTVAQGQSPGDWGLGPGHRMARRQQVSSRAGCGWWLSLPPTPPGLPAASRSPYTPVRVHSAPWLSKAKTEGRRDHRYAESGGREATLSGTRNVAIKGSLWGRSLIPLFGLEMLVKSFVILFI